MSTSLPPTSSFADSVHSLALNLNTLETKIENLSKKSEEDHGKLSEINGKIHDIQIDQKDLITIFDNKLNSLKDDLNKRIGEIEKTISRHTLYIAFFSALVASVGVTLLNKLLGG
ncbi:MAG: hypothetical protein LBJ61_02435 [Deltaproteobacteria bacterium]|jgi:archaellum component FlaC|nr:hypothetical protein [Deltaproteobacteria bacterium]